MITLDGQAARVLTAYVDLVVEKGLGGATLEALAGRAGLSKSGTLHHFASMRALRVALFAELRAQARRDAERLREAPEGPVRYYLVSSLDRDSELERLIEAAYRIAQTGDEAALEVLRACRTDWIDALVAATGDPALARMVLLVGDGVNHNALMSTGADDELLATSHVEELVQALDAMRAGSPQG
ncbi:TetR family transcriptional regulator [Agromyces sp. CFH 90414]|uniref:TetR family transcriptional regulator n=1 Tax=Agromyces agglutinans TaxID=2662258 RepID=A0A6I2F8T5_9MICO|nr:TetR/AcrR family transcriptional regulator [Agromyces agglutinans]MRG59130.1 TetR family transcriptional regulator [Agromyces agglutinans]